MQQIPDDKALEKIWAEVPPDYYFQLNYFQRLWHEWKWLIIKHLVTIPKISPKTILEVGCSGGHLSELLHYLFPKSQVIGIDVYKNAVVEAKKRFPNITFQVADAHKLPFKHKTFDLVVMSETIEHVVDPEKVLSEIARVLKPQGYALVEMDSGSLPFRIIWWGWTQFGKGQVWKNAHLHPFHSQELENLIKRSPLKIEKKMFSHFGMAVSFLVSVKNN